MYKENYNVNVENLLVIPTDVMELERLSSSASQAVFPRIHRPNIFNLPPLSLQLAISIQPFLHLMSPDYVKSVAVLLF